MFTNVTDFGHFYRLELITANDLVTAMTRKTLGCKIRWFTVKTSINLQFKKCEVMSSSLSYAGLALFCFLWILVNTTFEVMFTKLVFLFKCCFVILTILVLYACTVCVPYYLKAVLSHGRPCIRNPLIRPERVSIHRRSVVSPQHSLRYYNFW